MQTFNSLKEDFAFGQYRFQSLETVLAKDPGYVKGGYWGGYLWFI